LLIATSLGWFFCK